MKNIWIDEKRKKSFPTKFQDLNGQFNSIRCQFYQHSTRSFYARRYQKRKKILMTYLYFFLRFRDLRALKLYIERWWNWAQKASFRSPSRRHNSKMSNELQKSWEHCSRMHYAHRPGSHLNDHCSKKLGRFTNWKIKFCSCKTTRLFEEKFPSNVDWLVEQLEKTDQLMQERKSLFNRMWEEEQQRITTEQAIFKEQVRKETIRLMMMRIPSYTNDSQLCIFTAVNKQLFSFTVFFVMTGFIYIFSSLPKWLFLFLLKHLSCEVHYAVFTKSY